MKTTTRRRILAGAAAVPLLPAAALAAPVTLPVASYAAPANATDAAWAAYEVALAAQQGNEQAYRAVEAALPISTQPMFGDFEVRGEWNAAGEQWGQERAKYPKNPFDLDDNQLGALCEPLHAAEDAILNTPAATFTDVERKLAIISNWGGGHTIEADMVDSILADVRRLNGTNIAGVAS